MHEDQQGGREERGVCMRISREEGGKGCVHEDQQGEMERGRGGVHEDQQGGGRKGVCT